MNNLLKLYQSPLCGGVMICKDLSHNEAKYFLKAHKNFLSCSNFTIFSYLTFIEVFFFRIFGGPPANMVYPWPFSKSWVAVQSAVPVSWGLQYVDGLWMLKERLRFQSTYSKLIAQARVRAIFLIVQGCVTSRAVLL